MATGVTTLLRVSLFVATCVVWVIAQQDEEAGIPEWLFASTEDDDDATRIITTRKPNPGWVKGGTSCLNTDECGRGKCCLRRNRSPRRRCRRLQRINEPCTEEQMMGGYYYGHCPCNKNGVCTYTDKGLRCVRKKEEQPPELPPPQGPAQPPAIPPGLPPKQGSQESEEATGKPAGPAKPTDDDNELPELAFEKLRGPDENSNSIPPLTSHGSGSRPTSSSNQPTATAPGATPTNSILEPAPSSNPTGGFGLPVSTVPQQGGSGVPGQLGNTPLIAPPSQGPQASSPSTSTHGLTVPSSFPSPTSPGNNNLPQLGGQPSIIPPPPVPTVNSGLPSATPQQQRPSGLPPSPPTNVNLFPTTVEQTPSSFPRSQLPTTTGNNDILPPHADDGPPPPPLPPPPTDILNGRLTRTALQ